MEILAQIHLFLIKVIFSLFISISIIFMMILVKEMVSLRTKFVCRHVWSTEHAVLALRKPRIRELQPEQTKTMSTYNNRKIIKDFSLFIVDATYQ